MATRATDAGTNQSVERAVSVLRALDAGRAELRVSDVAELTGLGSSTTSRLLSTLERLDMVERDPVSNLYRLSLGILPLAATATNRHPVHRAARMVLQDLATRTGLGANVAVRRDSELMFLCNFEGHRAPKSYTQAGHTAPLHATSIGKCLPHRPHAQGAPQAASRAARGTHRLHDHQPRPPRRRDRHGPSHRLRDRSRGTSPGPGFPCRARPRRLGRRRRRHLPVGPGLLLGNHTETNGQRLALTREVIEAADAISQALGVL